MIVIDVTIVNVPVAVRSADLRLSADLVGVREWYLLTYGGFLLLGGPYRRYLGQRSLFLDGIAVKARPSSPAALDDAVG